MIITLHPHQKAAVDAVESALARGVRRPLIDACVASGKSYMFAELARRAHERGHRTIIGAHTRELVAQNAQACRDLMPGVPIGINAAALGERTWRAPVISAAIQSIYKSAAALGPIDLLGVDEAHLIGHSENGMYRDLCRDLGSPPTVGGSGTVFRLQGGSLVEGEGAPFDEVVFSYSILEGIRDGFLCEAFSIGATDKMDASKLRTRQGEYTGASQDAQMIALMDNHIMQMVDNGKDRRSWMVFEASKKSAYAMCARMNEWSIPTGIVLGETPAHERAATIEAFRRGRLRAVVNVVALATGFNVPQVDLLVMRRRTQSLGLYIQTVGRGLRTATGKTTCAVLDFAGNIDQHGPLDCITPKPSKHATILCDACGKRNAAASMRCWGCREPLTKNCPACLVAVRKGVMLCPHCDYDMTVPEGDGTPKEAKLDDLPSGAALLSAHRDTPMRAGGWLPILRMWDSGIADTGAKGVGKVMLPECLLSHAERAKWLRMGDDGPCAVLLPNGASRTSAVMIGLTGVPLIIPLPGVQNNC